MFWTLPAWLLTTFQTRRFQKEKKKKKKKQLRSLALNPTFSSFEHTGQFHSRVCCSKADQKTAGMHLSAHVLQELAALNLLLGTATDVIQFLRNRIPSFNATNEQICVQVVSAPSQITMEIKQGACHTKTSPAVQLCLF